MATVRTRGAAKTDEIGDGNGNGGTETVREVTAEEGGDGTPTGLENGDVEEIHRVADKPEEYQEEGDPKEGHPEEKGPGTPTSTEAKRARGLHAPAGTDQFVDIGPASTAQ